MTTTTINSATNSLVSLSTSGDALIVTNTGSIIVNSSYAVISTNGISIDNYGSIINTSNISSAYAIVIDISSTSFTNFTNYGDISSGSGSTIYISNNGLLYINSFTNFGTIVSTISGGVSIRIVYYYINSPSINIFNNLQSGLTFDGNIPSTYNIIINSLTQYGQLFCSGNNNISMTFGIYTPSTLSVGSYTSVLTGITANKINNVTGTYGVYNWSLLVRSDGTTWDLLISSGPEIETPENAACYQQPGGPQPPRLWSRWDNTCFNSNIPSTTLDMRRKAEILNYKANSAQLTKKQTWSQNVKGNGPNGKKVWANQNVLGSNPNVDRLPYGQGNTLICNVPLVQCSPSTSCNVPGPTIPICNEPNVPLTNYIVRRTYLAGGTKFPQTSWAPGDNGFPVGKAGKMF